MIKFLFQGDSITDAGRDREQENATNLSSPPLGYGYPLLFASDYLKNQSREYEFINRGISGNRIVDLYARIKRDIINLEPDVMSILIGVNDVWHEFGSKNGVAADKFEKIYDMLITEVKQSLPDIKIIILEPFVLEGIGTAEHYDEFRKEVIKRGDGAKRVAKKHGLVFVPLQAAFEKGATEISPEYWTTDGVHPTAAGHQLIKEALAEAVNKL